MLCTELRKEKLKSIHCCSCDYRILKNSLVLIAIKSAGIAISNDRDYRRIFIYIPPRASDLSVFWSFQALSYQKLIGELSPVKTQQEIGVYHSQQFRADVKNICRHVSLPCGCLWNGSQWNKFRILEGASKYCCQTTRRHLTTKIFFLFNDLRTSCFINWRCWYLKEETRNCRIVEYDPI